MAPRARHQLVCPHTVSEGIQAVQHEQLPRVEELRHAVLGAIRRRHVLVGTAQVQRRQHGQKHEHGLGLKADKPLAEERDDRAQQHRTGQEQEDAQQAEGGQHLGGQKQEEPVAHARRQRACDRKPQGRSRHPRGQHAQQRRGDHAAEGDRLHRAILVQRHEPSEQQHQQDANGDESDVESEVRIEAARRRAQHTRARRAGECQRRPGPGASVGANIAPAAPQERPTIFRLSHRFGHRLLSLIRHYTAKPTPGEGRRLRGRARKRRLRTYKPAT